MRFHTILG